MASTLIKNTTRRATTVYLPEDLLIAADRIVQSGMAHTRNELIAAGLRDIIRQINREAIDNDFAGMAADARYQEEAIAICNELAAAKWEAFQEREKQ